MERFSNSQTQWRSWNGKEVYVCRGNDFRMMSFRIGSFTHPSHPTILTVPIYQFVLKLLFWTHQYTFLVQEYSSKPRYVNHLQSFTNWKDLLHCDHLQNCKHSIVFFFFCKCIVKVTSKLLTSRKGRLLPSLLVHWDQIRA